MWSVPEGEGSISGTGDVFGLGGVPSGGFGTWKAPASSQTPCHFASIAFGSYFSIASAPISRQKSLSCERLRGSWRGAAAFASCPIQAAAACERKVAASPAGGQNRGRAV